VLHRRNLRRSNEKGGAKSPAFDFFKQ